MDVSAQLWWRHSDYRLKDGYVVGSGTRSDYDAWAKRGTVRLPAYLLLAQVPDEHRNESTSAPSPDEEERIISWSRQYGPTGVLLQRVVEVVFPDLAAHSWRGYGWYERSAGGGQPSALLRSLDGADSESDLVREELMETWWRFFPALWRDVFEWWPHVRAVQRPLGTVASELLSRDWPPPGTERFKGLYQESVPDFMEAAIALRRAFDFAQTSLRPRASAELRHRSLIPINHMTDSVRQALAPVTRGRVAQVWIGRSLLGSLAEMMASDLATGQSFERCPRASCQRWFRLVDPRTRYCSPQCADAEKARRHRRTMKERANHAEA